MLVLLCFQVRVRGSYRLEVTIYSYSNPNNQDFDGGCCEFQIVCSDPCETYFLFCLRNIDHDVLDSTCPLGAWSTSHSPISATTISFTPGQTIVSHVPNPIVFTGNSWPVSLFILRTHNLQKLLSCSSSCMHNHTRFTGQLPANGPSQRSGQS